VKYFLIVYNRDTGEVEIRGTYSASERSDAMRARFAAEREYNERAEFEVVVLGATSKTSLFRTHARYFKSKADILLNGIMPSPA